MEYILSLSYGKDSMACLGAIKELGWPLDRIVTADIWVTGTIPADLPEMVGWKAQADAIIKERWGITVEHIRGPHTVEDRIYRRRIRGYRAGEMVGWPRTIGCDIQSSCKREPLAKVTRGHISYWGIAADEPKRIKKHQRKPNVLMPLVEAGWTDAYCRYWCKQNGLLSPSYTTEKRGGCWFCPQQGLQSLRRLRKDYRPLWQLMLAWDEDSPTSFKSNGHSLRDYERRFQAEDNGQINPDSAFWWSMLDKIR